MTTHAILAVHLDTEPRCISRVKWREIDPAYNTYIGAESIADVGDVLTAIEAGDTVMAMFVVEDRMIPGARARISRSGTTSIESDNAHRHVGRTLIDLPRF